MRRLSIVLAISAMLAVLSGCASRGYVRKTVNSSSDALSARIEGNESEMKEIRDNLDKRVTGVDTRVTEVDSRVSSLDSKTTESFNNVRTDVRNVDQKAGDARTAADRAGGQVTVLDQKFQNRNNFNV